MPRLGGEEDRRGGKETNLDAMVVGVYGWFEVEV
jgi:hypothetical protein